LALVRIRRRPVAGAALLRARAMIRCYTAGVVILLTLGLSGCSDGEDGPLAVSYKPPAQAPSPLPSTTREAVEHAYRQYWSALAEATKLSSDEARVRLGLYATPAFIERRVRGIERLRSRSRETWGQPVVHVFAVEVSGKNATVVDCLDGSRTGQADARTHQPIPGTEGGERVHLRARLEQGTDSRWRVSALAYQDNPCTP
jgi:hypothetical protein